MRDEAGEGRKVAVGCGAVHTCVSSSGGMAAMVRQWGNDMRSEDAVTATHSGCPPPPNMLRIQALHAILLLTQLLEGSLSSAARQLVSAACSSSEHIGGL